MGGTYGYYGKFPALGDFVRGGVSRRFVNVWDPWLQAGIAYARSLLGAGWRELYATAPIWRFQLGAEIAHDRPIFGVMMPSQDAVGRLFPLTLLAEGMGADGGLQNDALFTPLEDIALEMLDTLNRKTRLEEMLAALPDPLPGATPTPRASQWLSAPDAEFGDPTSLTFSGLPEGAGFLSLMGYDPHAEDLGALL
ncbi:type VI secretion system-associated protein TagF [Abyssibius alkaniclasticus]|uniref:type VI secretion system-associated protein TagF n=1 Tax=Abyssibius alkaniclasticus TaxID=2881234 RepID=UPI002363A9FC|nr:type VI secretion system-associated protein TagF [Abyssibius alkaniclasticus]|tara:strand:- start:193 stop:777 length:585 start_codon:yes stop_codon:yes gene_type:complete